MIDIKLTLLGITIAAIIAILGAIYNSTIITIISLIIAALAAFLLVLYRELK